jgi:hypothetical protein
VWAAAAAWGEFGWPGRGLLGGVALVGPGGFERVVGGGPWVQFEVGALAAVLRAGAQPGGQLGEDGFGDAAALAVAGFAVGGVANGPLGRRA